MVETPFHPHPPPPSPPAVSPPTPPPHCAPPLPAHPTPPRFARSALCVSARAVPARRPVTRQPPPVYEQPPDGPRAPLPLRSPAVAAPARWTPSLAIGDQSPSTRIQSQPRRPPPPALPTTHRTIHQQLFGDGSTPGSVFQFARGVRDLAATPDAAGADRACSSILSPFSHSTSRPMHQPSHPKACGPASPSRALSLHGPIKHE